MRLQLLKLCSQASEASGLPRSHDLHNAPTQIVIYPTRALVMHAKDNTRCPEVQRQALQLIGYRYPGWVRGQELSVRWKASRTLAHLCVD